MNLEKLKLMLRLQSILAIVVKKNVLSENVSYRREMAQ